MNLPEVKNYSDYRAFLRDYYASAKKAKRGFSYRNFNRKAGITSPSLYREVVEGSRNLTEQSIRAFAKGLGLDRQDSEHFETLVKFNQAKDPTEKQQHLQLLRNVRQRSRKKTIGDESGAYFEKWYNPVIRELACTVDWKGDYRLLAKAVAPSITPEQAREAVELLLSLKLLTGGDDNSYRQNDPYIATEAETPIAAVRGLNQQICMLGVEAVERFSPSQRDVSTMVIGISQKGYGQIKELIQEFKKRIAQIAEDDAQSDTVYNVAVNLYPASQPVRKNCLKE